MATKNPNISPTISKVVLVDKLRKIAETELDDVLQGDYDEREEILADFNDILDRILEYQIYQDKK